MHFKNIFIYALIILGMFAILGHSTESNEKNSTDRNGAIGQVPRLNPCKDCKWCSQDRKTCIRKKNSVSIILCNFYNKYFKSVNFKRELPLST